MLLLQVFLYEIWVGIRCQVPNVLNLIKFLLSLDHILVLNILHELNIFFDGIQSLYFVDIEKFMK